MRKKLALHGLLFAGALTLSAHSTRAQSHGWSGFYAGGNGFASSDKSDASAGLTIQQISGLLIGNPPTTVILVPGTSRDFAASRRETNWGGGGQAGYQRQVGRFVFGGEGDFNPFHRTFNVSQSFQLPPTSLTPVTTVDARRDVRLSREFSIRARAGAAFGKTLIYGTGGYANARARASSIDSFTNPGGLAAPNLSSGPFNSGPEGPVVTTASATQNINGWNAGLGFDYKLGKRLSIGFEYHHTDYGSKIFAFSNGTIVNTGPETHGTNGGTGQLGFVFPGSTRISLKSDSFGVRINYHF